MPFRCPRALLLGHAFLGARSRAATLPCQLWCDRALCLAGLCSLLTRCVQSTAKARRTHSPSAPSAHGVWTFGVLCCMRHFRCVRGRRGQFGCVQRYGLPCVHIAQEQCRQAEVRVVQQAAADAMNRALEAEHEERQRFLLAVEYV